MQQPVDFYCHPTPNPSKVAYFLEKSGIANRLIPVDIAKGDQHSAEFRALNQNGKVPVAAENGIAILDSSAILLPPPRSCTLPKRPVPPRPHTEMALLDLDVKGEAF
ncbi:glutathione S-transferase N-terminal domain-containing protein [Pseudomonas aeruginosa]|uniref:glutathione S-transferase N-terminal domain-containing protein n=1 Tax=Pseudomonas aeruginosa TaxID=287 RepID=UPI0040545117